MKKILTIALLSVFILSIMPISFAQETGDQARESLMDRYKEVNEARTQIRADIKETRQIVKDLHEKLAKCREEQNCEEVKEELKVEGRGLVVHATQNLIKRLENLKERVQNSQNLSDENKNELLESLNAEIDKIQAELDEFEALGEDATRAELKEQAAQIRNAWKNAKVVAKKVILALAQDRMNGALAHLGKLEERFEKTEETLKAKGKDTTKLNQLMNEYSEAVDEAERAAEAAGDRINEISRNREDTPQDTKTDGTLKNAHTQIKEAFKAAKAVISEIKSLNEGKLEVERKEAVEIGN